MFQFQAARSRPNFSPSRSDFYDVETVHLSVKYLSWRLATIFTRLTLDKISLTFCHFLHRKIVVLLIIMLASKTKYTNSVFERRFRRKNKLPSGTKEQVDRFIDSDKEHFLYFPEEQQNIAERTQTLSPDLVLFLVLAGD